MDEMKVVDKSLDSDRIEYDTTQFIVIKLGNEQYGIDIQYIDNILRMQNITRVPKVAPYLKGAINLRGEVIPVMSIRQKMGLPADEITKATRIIILKLEQHGMIGIMVDEVKEVVTLNNGEIEKVSYDNKEEKTTFISGIGKEDGNLISLLDLNAVVAEKENA
ncbi:MAG: chemotaxis protein CheW [Clostridiales bacterium]|nr:chemotaxis protein CheW [Clostridiales bacterium]